MKVYAALFFNLFACSMNLVAQDSTGKNKTWRFAVYSPLLSDEYGIPVAIGGGIAKNKHALLTAPIFYSRYSSGKRLFGWNLTYNFSPNPENKRFQLYFPVMLQWQYYYDERKYSVYNKSYPYQPIPVDANYSYNLLSLVTGYGFVTKLKRIGIMCQLTIGIRTRSHNINYFYQDTGQEYFSRETPLGKGWDGCGGAMLGLYYDLYRK